MNWYSKRMLLTGVYTSTEWYMTTDSSHNFDQTWGFLDRRLENVVQLGKSASQFGSMIEFATRSASGILEAVI